MILEIGVKGQEKLKQAKVLVVGAGGLGCPVLQYLAAAGLGKIVISLLFFSCTPILFRVVKFATADHELVSEGAELQIAFT